MRHVVIVLVALLLVACTEGVSQTGDPPAPARAGATAAEVVVTPADIAMAREVIAANTMNLPGLLPGSSTTAGPGPLSGADALALYLVKFHQQTGVCPPAEVVAEMAAQLEETETHRKALAVFWRDYSTARREPGSLEDPGHLRESFEWYIAAKQAERLRRGNAALEGFVAADEAWRKAADAQRESWQRARDREDAYIVERDAYRVLLDGQAAIAAAEAAVQGGG